MEISSRLTALKIINRYKSRNTNLSELLSSELNRTPGNKPGFCNRREDPASSAGKRDEAFVAAELALPVDVKDVKPNGGEASFAATSKEKIGPAAAGSNPASYSKTRVMDYGFIRGLVWGVVRYLRTLDWVINKYSDRKTVDAGIRNILRLGLFQLLYCKGEVPEYAAINESVELTRLAHMPLGASFVNAVLRKAQKSRDSLLLFDNCSDITETIGLKYSYPTWLVKRWMDKYGAAETQLICEAGNSLAPLTIRANSAKISRENLKAMLEKEGEQVEYCGFSPDGLKFISKPRLEKLESFKSGLFWLQDEASQLVSYLLSVHPGEDVLDLCCGSGVKSCHLALLTGNTGKITAVDNSPERIVKASQNFSRFGITNVKLLKADVEKLKNFKAAKVLLDAPCSGLGALRRKPDIKWNRTQEDVTARYPAIQKQLLNAAAGYVLPGGTLVYCTCTTEPEENEKVIEEFLNTNKDFTLEKPELPGKAQELVLTDSRYYRTFAHIHGTDCFFGAKLVKKNN